MVAVADDAEDVDLTGDWVLGVKGRDVGRDFSVDFSDLWLFFEAANRVPSYVTLLISIVTTNSGSPFWEIPAIRRIMG